MEKSIKKKKYFHLILWILGTLIILINTYNIGIVIPKIESNVDSLQNEIDLQYNKSSELRQVYIESKISNYNAYNVRNFYLVSNNIKLGQEIRKAYINCLLPLITFEEKDDYAKKWQKMTGDELQQEYINLSRKFAFRVSELSAELRILKVELNESKSRKLKRQKGIITWQIIGLLLVSTAEFFKRRNEK